MSISALLIDPATHTIEPFTITSWRAIAPAIGCALFTVIQTPTITLYLDDEGLFVEGQRYFRFLPYSVSYPLAGRALAVGASDEEGNDTDIGAEASALARLIRWCPASLKFSHMETREGTLPNGAFYIQNSPVFIIGSH